MEAGASVRRWLLLRGERRRDGNVSEGKRELSGIEAGACASPVHGSDLNVAVAGPVGVAVYVFLGGAGGLATT